MGSFEASIEGQTRFVGPCTRKFIKIFILLFFIHFPIARTQDEVAEWLRRWTANPLGSARVGSNPILVEPGSMV